MYKPFLYLTVFLYCAIYAHSQPHFWKSKDAYPGQTPPSDTPRKFAPQLLVPDSGIALDRSAFSADGKEFYYCTAQHWFDSKGAAIRCFRFENKKWNGPFLLFKKLYAPTFSINDQSLYFLGGGKGVIMQSHRTGTGWSPPDTFFRRSYGVYDFMPTKSGNMYAASNIGGPITDFSFYDVCILPDNNDTVAKTLGKPLNTSGFDGDFYVAPDESFIIISANETKDFECELHISFRRKDNTWTPPVSLGPLINNGVAHRWGEYVTPDGKYLFYSQGTSQQDCALYWVRFDHLLKKLVPKVL